MKNCILQPTSVSHSLHCCPHILLVKFENLVHSTFRNKNSNLEINVGHFGVLYWQQWQPPPCICPWKGHNEPWFIKGFRSWLYFSGGSKDLWTWTFIHTSRPVQYVSQRVLFSMLLEVSLVVPVFKNVWERCTTKNERPVCLLTLVGKVFEKLVNNGIVDQLEKYGLFLCPVSS